MNVRSIALAAVAVAAASAAFANEPKAEQRESRPPSRELPLLAEVVAGMREVLRAVTPEISLPVLDIQLPTLAADRR